MRQFDASADFPHVTPLEEYSQNWNDAGPDDRSRSDWLQRAADRDLST